MQALVFKNKKGIKFYSCYKIKLNQIKKSVVRPLRQHQHTSSLTI